jgi:hypothetical protein
MYNYLNHKFPLKPKKLDFSILKRKRKSRAYIVSLQKNSKFDYFYWKYIYGDFVVSKFINFLVQSGYKNRAIKLFFRALSNLKNKFGLNPILLIKYIVLKRNVLHKVTKKKVKQKTFYYLRLLDFEKQISNTIKKLMDLIFFLKEKKNIKLWQSIFLILLNFSILKNKKKIHHSLKYNVKVFKQKIKRVIKSFSIRRMYNTIKNKFVKLYSLLKSYIFFFSNVFNIIFNFKFFIKNDILNHVDLECFLNFLLFYKKLYYHYRIMKLRFFYFKKRYSSRFNSFRNKIRRFFYFFKYLRNRNLLNRIDAFRRRQFFKKVLLSNKQLLLNKYRQQFLTRFFIKDLNDLKEAVKSKNSFLNFRLRKKKRKELSIGTRIHTSHNVRLRHRKIFFRVSKYGQSKIK